jgi:hypothetical protein
MKTAITAIVLIGVFLAMAFAVGRKPIAEVPIEESEVRVADIPTVFLRLKAAAEEEAFAVFIFSPGSGPFSADEAINLQFCFEDGSAGVDWVLLGQPNIRDRKKYEQLAASLGYKVVPRKKNGVHYLRVTEGDLPRLCERVICDLYGKQSGSSIGLLTKGFTWP